MYNMNKHANSNETVNILLQHAMGLHWQQVYRGWAPTDTKARVPSDTYSTFLIVPVKFSSKKNSNYTLVNQQVHYVYDLLLIRTNAREVSTLALNDSVNSSFLFAWPTRINTMFLLRAYTNRYCLNI